MFIQTEATPNPATLKFLPGKPVLEQGVREFRTTQEAEVSPLAARLFGIEGVRAVFLGADFVAVTKDEGAWTHLKPLILGAIMEHYLSGMPILNTEGTASTPGQDLENREEEFFDEADREIVGTIKELLETRVRPAVAQDGGDIAFRGFKDGIVFLSMHGACSGCPSSTATLQYGVQNLLRHFIPEIKEVRSV